MVFGWLVDPRTHLVGLGLMIGAVLFFPEMADVTNEVEDRAVETIERVSEDARLALGLEYESID
ncbi:hypothetical protein [Tautonia marina]|uniref:hypothetical protein n=1 Tax=Tautonia marina TaxID=2653855 RepID=UPI001260A43C|nr:hypothetical protein [Tautonia marina]